MFKEGQPVKCIRAPEPGIPLVEGAVYFVTTYNSGDRSDMKGKPSVTLREVPGLFDASRFEAY